MIYGKGTGKIVTGEICPYCKNPTEWVDSKVIYGRSYGMMFLCAPCDAYVGCHNGGGGRHSMGRLANKSLREAKKAAHSYFDKLWRSGGMSRKEAYAWLRLQMDIPAELCHIGMFDEKLCARVVALCKGKL